MKICWDTLDGIKLTKNNVFLKNGSASYIYVEKCENCGEPYLTIKHNPSNFCCKSCAVTGKNHPMYGKHLTKEHKEKLSIAFLGEKNHFFGKHHTKESKQKISKKAAGRKHSKEVKKEMSRSRKGKPIHSEEHRKKLSKKFAGSGNPMYGLTGELSPMYGREVTDETRKWLSEAHKGLQVGENNPNWKGGISCEPYCQVWSDKEYKESIKQRDYHTCQNPYCYKKAKRLHIHHVDYNKKNCGPDNLITVCVGCNSRANKDREWHTAWYQIIMNHKYGYVY